MFHRNAIFVNGAFLGFSVLSYCFTSAMNQSVSEVDLFSTCECYLFQLKSLFEIFIGIGVISVVFVFISSHLTTVKIGKPSMECLTIAYRYGLSDSVSTSDVMRSRNILPSCDKIQICYEKKSGPFGLAYGVVVSEPLSDEKRLELLSDGYSFLKTKPVSNAIYISCPTVPWLSYFGQWLILSVIYPKLYQYSKKHKLSAYPVVELYQRFSISLIAPLSQQDVFVVPEAEYLMRRSSTKPDLSDSSIERSSSASYHSVRAKLSETNNNYKVKPSTFKHSLSLTKNVKPTKITPTRSLTPFFTANIILKPDLSSVDNNISEPIFVRSSTPLVSNGVIGKIKELEFD